MIKKISYWFQNHKYQDFNNYNDYWAKNLEDRNTGESHYLTLINYLKNKSVLDIGCGVGELLQSLSYRNYHKKKLIGYDVSYQALKIVKKKGFNVVTSLEDVKFIDCITVLSVLEHVQDAEQLFKVLTQKTNLIIIRIPNPAFIMYRLRLLFGSFPMMSIKYHMKEHIRFWTVKDFKYWIKTLFPKWEIISVKADYKSNFLSRKIPSLFANNIYYVIKKKS